MQNPVISICISHHSILVLGCGEIMESPWVGKDKPIGAQEISHNTMVMLWVERRMRYRQGRARVWEGATLRSRNEGVILTGVGFLGRRGEFSESHPVFRRFINNMGNDMSA